MLLLLSVFWNCNRKIESMSHKYTNALIHESSPYLLQHAHNPVNWVAWSPEILEQAQRENKLLLISIGYAACHWCHVMENECFEDEEVAEVMNSNFINVKIDREERPDIDHIYMDAVQMMTGRGGWPLNVVALPDGRPFWGATYVKKADWIKVLEQLSEMYNKEPEKVTAYAKDLARGIKAINLIEPTTSPEALSKSDLESAVKDWSSYFDREMGGYRRAPKFMMPVNLDFLLHYAWAEQNNDIMGYVDLTLTKMAYGGVYDHLGGGFARYSVDHRWHVPHFEKMLYDNGQLVSLYAQAYGVTKNELYRDVVDETISFVARELMSVEGGFYSSLDADSLDKEGNLEEGAYYVWSSEELEELLQVDFPLFSAYYNVNATGFWEEGKYVLIRTRSNREIAEEFQLSKSELKKKLSLCKEKLLEVRQQRNKPRLDDKILTSWNGHMLKGLLEAYRYLGNKNYLDLALRNANFIKEELIGEDYSLLHNYKEGKSSINGYLEDYASLIDAYIALYEVSFDENWLQLARALTNYCIDNYWAPDAGLFYFTSKKDHFIIRRTLETSDNVVPASNSMMARNLFKLSKLLFEPKLEDMANEMLGAVQSNLQKDIAGYPNWLHLVLYSENPFYEVAVSGQAVNDISRELQNHYLPNTVFAGSAGESNLPLLEKRFKSGETLIYLCEKGACKLPEKIPEKVLGQLESKPKPF